ncbi:MAG: hypothetical protein JWP34_4462 [Massilia sp.]|jgi:hypothetical protein|nr:hypothetical protein [Massilia sp.]
MSALKHMEVIFAALLTAGCILLALPGQPDTAQAQQAATGAMPVVVVKAKRMTALEKRQSQELDTSPRSAAAGS